MAITRMRRRARPRCSWRAAWLPAAAQSIERTYAVREFASAVAVALVLGAAPAAAENWRFVPGIAVQETATTNVDLRPSGSAREDLVTEVTPSLSFRGIGSHAEFTGQVSVPVLIYARTGGDNNYAFPSANLFGKVEVVDGFFYIDGAISIAQQFLNPFGAQPLGFANSTENRYRTDTYRVSPYIRGVAPGDIRYEVRNNNVWTNLSGAPIATSNGNFTDWIGNASSASGTTLGWDVRKHGASGRNQSIVGGKR